MGIISLCEQYTSGRQGDTTYRCVIARLLKYRNMGRLRDPRFEFKCSFARASWSLVRVLARINGTNYKRAPHPQWLKQEIDASQNQAQKWSLWTLLSGKSQRR